MTKKLKLRGGTPWNGDIDWHCNEEFIKPDLNLISTLGINSWEKNKKEFFLR